MTTTVFSLANKPPVDKVRPDPIPNIRNAGKMIITGGANSDLCIRQDLFSKEHAGNPGTPEAIRKYRKLQQNIPGKIQVHQGLQGLRQSVPVGHSYGRPNFGSDHVNEVIRAQNLSGLADKFNDIREGAYASNKREPLGSSICRTYNWPQAAQRGTIAFGLPSKDSMNAKDVLYPKSGANAEKPEHAKMYVQTHGNYAAGEQRTRDYNWNITNIDNAPKTFAFGFGEQRLLNGAAKAVHVERYEGVFPKTVIVNKIVEDVKSTQADRLGESKNLGQGQARRNSSFIHGIRNSTKDWNAAKCLTGEPSMRQIAPDRDLGKSVKINCTNTVRRSQDESRVFGCPSIRTDIPFKVKRSVADYQNYGDEPEVVDLLFPQTHTELGITEYDFQTVRPREFIQTLFEKIGQNFRVGKFNAIFNRAKELCGSSNDCVSVRAFMQAAQIYKDIK